MWIKKSIKNTDISKKKRKIVSYKKYSKDEN